MPVPPMGCAGVRQAHTVRVLIWTGSRLVPVQACSSRYGPATQEVGADTEKRLSLYR